MASNCSFMTLQTFMRGQYGITVCIIVLAFGLPLQHLMVAPKK